MRTMIWIGGVLGAGLSVNSPAQACASIALGAGALRMDPRSTSGPLIVREIGGQPANISQTGTSFKAAPAKTLLLTLDCEITAQWSLRFAFGLPPTHDLTGAGSLADFGVIGEGQQWSPTLLAIWTTNSRSTSVRPFMGVGFNYTFFRRTRITNDQFLSQVFGPNASASVDLTRSWNPVATAGITWPVSERWSIEAAATYMPLKARATVNVSDAAPGEVRAISELKNRALAGSLILRHTWR